MEYAPLLMQGGNPIEKAMKKLIGLVLLVSANIVFAQQAVKTVDMYENPSCPCCKNWAAYMRENGYKVNVHNVDDIDAARRKLGMPQKYGSCHTAVIGGYLVEGHVPVSDIQKLLTEKPKAIGLAVPGMVTGSPGMEGANPQHYNTLLVRSDGSASVYANH
jgi:hypothetical protein